jgi:ATP-binding cassette subfamily F protein uup
VNTKAASPTGRPSARACWRRRPWQRHRPPRPPRPPPSPLAAPAAARRKLSYKEQRERDELPARIAALEAEQATISARLADGTLFAKAPAEATALSQRHAAIDDELLAALERQEELGAS